MNIEVYISKFEVIRERIGSINSVISETVKNNEDIILSLNRDQLLYGRDSSGNELYPSYLQDPYFKSRESAEAYARRKYAMQSYHNSLIWNPVQLFPNKDRNTPNLIIRGDFQNAMFIRTLADSFIISSTYIDTTEIDRKYNNNLFGLANPSIDYFWKEYLLTALRNYLYV